jgi:hypothetical protein
MFPGKLRCELSANSLENLQFGPIQGIPKGTLALLVPAARNRADLIADGCFGYNVNVVEIYD